jgi:hypothetical protein
LSLMQKNTGYTYTPDNKAFEIRLPAAPKIVRDSTLNEMIYYGKTIDCFSTNPNSGGLFMFEHVELNEFFKIKSLDKHYEEFIKNHIAYNDSVISSDSVSMDGNPGKEYVLFRAASDNPQRVRIWLYNDRFFYLTAYNGKDELFNEESNLIFNSFKILNRSNSFDVFGSKAEKLIAGLSSPDTTISKPSVGALNYYEFTSDEVPLLTGSINKEYPNDTGSEGIRVKLIRAMKKIKDPDLIPTLEQLYVSASANDYMKTEILSAIPDISKEGYPVYLKLLLTGKTLKNKKNRWKIFQPLKDSLAFAEQNFDQLIGLVDSSAYRDDILSLACGIIDEDSTKKFLNTYFNTLSKHVLADLELYKKNLAESSSPFYYQPEIYSYLNLMNNTISSNVIDQFTSGLLDIREKSTYTTTETVTARIHNNLPVDKKIITSELEEMSSRYMILSAFHKMKQLDKVPSKYTRQPEFAKLCFYRYMGYMDSYPDKIKLLGTVPSGDSIVYVFQYSFDTDEKKDPNYIGISGPYAKSGTIEFNDDLNSYTDFAETQEDWKTQAKGMIAILKEESY